MKRISLIPVVIAILALVLVGACGGDNGEEETTAATTPATSAATTTTQTTQPPSGGGGGLTWNDMPIYGGADQIEEFSMSFAPDEADYSEFEWRYYETGADVGDVINFYKDKSRSLFRRQRMNMLHDDRFLAGEFLRLRFDTLRCIE